MVKRRYGQWAGNPKGEPEKILNCIKSVYDSSGYGKNIPHQCTRKRGHGKDELYCKQHSKRNPAEEK